MGGRECEELAYIASSHPPWFTDTWSMLLLSSFHWLPLFHGCISSLNNDEDDKPACYTCLCSEEPNEQGNVISSLRHLWNQSPRRSFPKSLNVYFKAGQFHSRRELENHWAIGSSPFIFPVRILYFQWESCSWTASRRRSWQKSNIKALKPTYIKLPLNPYDR